MTEADMISCWRLVEQLTAEEANSVTILSPNADFGGPSCAILVSTDWTNYLDRRFEGESLLECLTAANLARLRGGR